MRAETLELLSDLEDIISRQEKIIRTLLAEIALFRALTDEEERIMAEDADNG